MNLLSWWEADRRQETNNQSITSRMWRVTKKGNHITERTDGNSARGIVLQLCLARVRSHLKYQTSSGALCFRKGMGHLEKAQKIPVSMARGPEIMLVKKDLEQRTEERGEMWSRSSNSKETPKRRLAKHLQGLAWVQVNRSGGERRDQEALKVPPTFSF